MVRVDFREKAWQYLAMSVLIDLLSVANLGLPLIGELIDLVWAPISAYFLHRMYQTTVLTRVQFFKEILPFTDILPVATLSWALEYTSIGRAFGRRFGLRPRQAPA